MSESLFYGGAQDNGNTSSGTFNTVIGLGRIGWGTGGLIFGLMPQALRCTAPPEVQWIIYGVGIILIVFFLPRGIVPAFAQLARMRMPKLQRPAGIAP